MNGDEIRDTWFAGSRVWGYYKPDVDDLLHRVAAELDAGRPAGSLIENAVLRTRFSWQRYDVDAVDWFLDQLLRSGGNERAGTGAGPWHDAGEVTQLARGLAERYPDDRPASQEAGPSFAGPFLAEQCEDAWRGFGQQPGAHLWWGQVGTALRQLRTAEQQVLASLQGRGPGLWAGGTPVPKTVSAGGRSFTFQRMDPGRSSPAVGGIAARSARDYNGHFAEPGRGQERRASVKSVLALVDEPGIPILYASGDNYRLRACACVSFPDGRWLRFLVRGTDRANAIMTAVDQAGTSAARYRIAGGRSLGGTLRGWPKPVEITVNPSWELTDELVLAIAISAGWLWTYFAGAKAA